MPCPAKPSPHALPLPMSSQATTAPLTPCYVTHNIPHAHHPLLHIHKNHMYKHVYLSPLSLLISTHNLPTPLTPCDAIHEKHYSPYPLLCHPKTSPRTVPVTPHSKGYKLISFFNLSLTPCCVIPQLPHTPCPLLCHTQASHKPCL